MTLGALSQARRRRVPAKVVFAGKSSKTPPTRREIPSARRTGRPVGGAAPKSARAVDRSIRIEEGSFRASREPLIILRVIIPGKSGWAQTPEADIFLSPATR